MFGNEKGHVVIREVPSLALRKSYSVYKEGPVWSVCLSGDQRYIYVGTQDQEMAIITHIYSQ